MCNLPYPVIQENADDATFTLHENYKAFLPNSRILRVKKGFVTDFASVPRIFWNVIAPTHGQHTRAAFIHDALYSARALSRTECDWMFLQIMQDCGVSWIKRNTMYSAVRTCGGFVWMKHTPESIAEARKIITLR